MKKLMIFVGIILFGLTLRAQQGMSTSSSAAEEKAIRDISKSWLEMEKSNDIDGMVKLFDDEATLYRSNLEPIKGLDAIRKRFTEEGEKNPKEVVDWSTDKVEVASSGDLAVEFGKFNVKNSGLNANESDEGTYVTVYRKKNGEWKVIADVSTSTKPETPKQ
jgi:uncharacterized protein (TIGR02246 family)